MVILAIPALLYAPSPAAAWHARIIDDNDTVILRGNVHPDARAEFDRGVSPPSLPLERMILTLRRSPQQQADLDRYLIDLHDSASPGFQHWLTPDDFGARFGPVSADLEAVTRWLRSHGFAIDEVARSGAWINFSGTAGQVEKTFHTPIHIYLVDGRVHHANARDPAIPRGLSDIVAGIDTLHDFPRRAMNGGAGPVPRTGRSPDYTDGANHYLSPADFATIYNVGALYAAGVDGTGQSIAIVGRTHPPASNWATFRSIMALPANPPQVIVNGPDPGDLGGNEDFEADLDVEWSGGVARNATIKFIVSKSTFATDGVDLSAQYIVNNNLAPVMSTSFGSCESAMGTAENNFYRNLWQQAAAQGITSFVSSGDSGAAGCDAPTETSATQGLGVNGLASTPYNIAVGGTQFNEGSGSYWSATNTGYSSALIYIPEAAWNESGITAGSGLWSTGGGASTRYSKPAWQVCPGVPADSKRDVPDVSLSAAQHDGYLIVSQSGGLYSVGGTSASSPSFAGLMALVTQKAGTRQGNANPRFYQLGNAQYGSGGVAVFHDSTSGSNTVPGVTGYNSTAGYDLATGLGSVDAAALVTNWTPDFTVAAAPSALVVPQGSSGTTTVSTSVLGNFNSALSLSLSGLPAGATAAFSQNPITAPGSGSSLLTVTTGSLTSAGVYPLTVSAIGSSVTHAAPVSLTVLQVFAITSSVTNGIGGTITPSDASIIAGGNAVLTITPSTGYHLASLTDNGVDVTTDVTNGTYTIMNVTTNRRLVATFGINTYSVSAIVTGGSGTIVPAASIVSYGNPITLTITPDSGYTLGGLTDNGTAVSATSTGSGSYTYTITSVTENHTVQANFAMIASSVPAIGIWGMILITALLGVLVDMRRQSKKEG